MTFSPISLTIDCTAFSLEKGSSIRFDMDCSGKNPLIAFAVSHDTNFQPSIPNKICSTMAHKIKNPRAKAERFTNIPRKRQKEKKPTNLRKKANRNSKSEKMIGSSLKSE